LGAILAGTAKATAKTAGRHVFASDILRLEEEFPTRTRITGIAMYSK
jgi:hypothetical protein